MKPSLLLPVLLLGALVAPIQSLDLPKAEDPPPNPQLIVIARLHRLGASLACGYYTTGAMAEYVDIKVISGSWSKNSILVAHACPELPREKMSKFAGSLDRFRVGDIHRLELTSENLYQIEILKSLDGREQAAPDYYSIRVDPADSTDSGAPSNQSFERTGLGRLVSLRSATAVLARRSTQVR